jgi:hypothetical protein
MTNHPIPTNPPPEPERRGLTLSDVLQQVLMPSKPHRDSLNHKLMAMRPRDRIYIETTLDGFPGVQRGVTAKSRRPSSMEGMEFTCALFTAVSCSKAGDIRYLVAVERTR